MVISLKNGKCLALAFLVLTTIGCGQADTLDRVSIYGSVSADGQAVDSGSLSFVPVDGGPATGTPIDRGAYSIEASRGPVPGAYRVRINMGRGKALSASQLSEKPPTTYEPAVVTIPDGGGTVDLSFEPVLAAPE